MMARCDQVFADEAKELLSQTVSSTTTDQVVVTTSGFFALTPMMPLQMTFGADRVMFSADYPFSPNAKGRGFLDSLPLLVADIAHGNTDCLLKIKPAGV